MIRTRNGIEVIGIFRKMSSYVVSIYNVNYIMNENGKLLDRLKSTEEGYYETLLTEKEINRAVSLKCTLSDRLDEFMDKEDSVRKLI